MIETPQQYSDRILNNLGNQNPIDVIESTISRLEALTNSLQGLENKASREKWTATQILAHLAEAEIVWAYRFRKVLNASGDAIEAYDQNEWVKNSGYLQTDPHLAFSLFEIVRKANIAFLKSLSPQQLEHFGIHSQRGKESIAQMLKLMAGHDINHLHQMEKML